MRVAAATVAMAAIAAVAFALIDRSSAPSQSGERCITVSIASSMGGAVERACGAAARNSCQAAYRKHDIHSAAVQEACQTAGIRR
jgi:hypothetical protein